MAVAMILIPSHDLSDSDFSSGASPPHLSYSAPTSPNHLTHFYRNFDDLFAGGEESCGGCGSAVVSGGAAASVPFGWGEKPMSPRGETDNREEYDFSFDVIEDREKASLSADELFDGGVIKPLKPPAPSMIGENAPSPRRNLAAVPRSPISRNRDQFDPSVAAAQSPTRSSAPPPRGREKGVNRPKASSRRAARSLSPIRDAQSPSEEENDEQPHRNRTNSTPATVCSALPAPLRGHNKWRLKDLFLFRSASEGRAADKDPLKRHTAAFRHSSDGSRSGSGSRRRGAVSAHELHYTVNRAVSEDLKKKTFLPYKQGILGRLSFNPSVANGFGFSRR